MATEAGTVEFICELIAGAGLITARKMFGEYAIYCDGKVVAFVCNDQLFVKPTPGAREVLGEVVEAPAYPGSKMYFLIEEGLDDPELLTRVIAMVASEAPPPKPKKPKVAKPKTIKPKQE